MRVIQVSKQTLPEIREEVTRKQLWHIRRMAKQAKRLGVSLFFIPEYLFPECGDIPRLHFVSENYLQEHFLIGSHIRNTSWITIKPRVRNKSFSEPLRKD